MAHAFAELARLSLYEKSRALDKAYASAKILRAIAKPHNLLWHLGRAERAIAGYEGHDPAWPQPGGIDEF
jgi:hypothetical protein